MAKLAWSRVGERFFETGIDRGVIYPNKVDLAPAAWSGLVGINENPTGGDAKPFYIDGYKFQNRSAPEEYGASIEAFFYPRVFDECQGNPHLGSGLTMTAQAKIPFGLSYRTKLGNDIAGQNYGYKLHFVYNALVAPTNKNYQTVSDNPIPNTFSWNITTKAIKVAGRRQTAHMVVDTTLLSPPLLLELENLIYGTDDDPPQLPNPTELIALIVGWPTLFVTDHGNGIFTASGPDEVVRLATPRAYEITAETAEADGNGNFEVTSY